MNDANVIITPEQGEDELVSQIASLASRLGGKMEQTITLNSVGRSSKKIIVEYDVHQKEV